MTLRWYCEKCFLFFTSENVKPKNLTCPRCKYNAWYKREMKEINLKRDGIVL